MNHAHCYNNNAFPRANQGQMNVKTWTDLTDCVPEAGVRMITCWLGFARRSCCVVLLRAINCVVEWINAIASPRTGTVLRSLVNYVPRAGRADRDIVNVVRWYGGRPLCIWPPSHRVSLSGYFGRKSLIFSMRRISITPHDEWIMPDWCGTVTDQSEGHGVKALLRLVAWAPDCTT